MTFGYVSSNKTFLLEEVTFMFLRVLILQSLYLYGVISQYEYFNLHTIYVLLTTSLFMNWFQYLVFISVSSRTIADVVLGCALHIFCTLRLSQKMVNESVTLKRS